MSNSTYYIIYVLHLGQQNCVGEPEHNKMSLPYKIALSMSLRNSSLQLLAVNLPKGRRVLLDIVFANGSILTDLLAIL